MTEFDIIDFFKAQTIERPDVVIGIGDDAAVLSSSKNLAIATDTLVEGVHFPVDTSAYDIGYKSLAVNLSDLAAMGAEPAVATLALTIPKANEEWISQFSYGFFDLAAHHNLQLIGGDTTRGPLRITVQVIGYVDKPIKRSGAQVGDSIYVTGYLGDAALALAGLSGKIKVSDEENKYLMSRLNLPTPRVEAGLLLKDIANAAIDISDGLIVDLKHILAASFVGAEVFVDKIPLSDEMKNTLTIEKALPFALNGGDDYELCFTVPAEKKHLLPTAFIEIGKIVAGDNLVLKYSDGKNYVGETSGYKHF